MMSAVIQINLLPEGAKANKRTRSQKRAPSQLIALLKQHMVLVLISLGVVLMLVYTIGVMVSVSRARGKHRQLEARWAALASTRQTLDELTDNQIRLAKQLETLSAVVGEPIAWSVMMNHISDALPQTIWLTKLEVRSPRYLSVEGTALESSAGEGMQAVSELLSTLQRDPVFASVFNKITLQSFSRRRVGSTDVLDFVLQFLEQGAASSTEGSSYEKTL